METRYFKNEESGEIVVVDTELEKFSYIGGMKEITADGDENRLEIDMACIGQGTIFEPNNYGIQAHRPYKLVDCYGDEIKVIDLDEHAEGDIYWNGSNWILILFQDDFNETGWKEITDEMPEINFKKCVASKDDFKPGIDYTLYADENESLWLRESSRWQGSLPWDTIYEVSEDDAEKWDNDDDFEFSDLIREVTTGAQGVYC